MRSIVSCLFIIILGCSKPFAASLVIGTSVFNPPLETASDNQGHFFGFEIDLMNEICRRINEKCRYKGLTFEKLVSETLSGEVDLALDAISITTKRLDTYLFSLPYMASEAQLLIIVNSTLTTLKDVDGKRVGVEAGTLFKEWAQDEFNNVKVVDYKNQADLLQALLNNDVDVIIINKSNASYWVNNNGNLFKLLGDGIKIGIGFGIMTNMNNAKLIDRINQALIQIENDGTYTLIYGRYFL